MCNGLGKIRADYEKCDKCQDIQSNFTKIDTHNTCNNCVICLNGMNHDIIMLKCDHIFHSKCILDWNVYGNGKTCPICRKNILGSKDNSPVNDTTHSEQIEFEIPFEQMTNTQIALQLGLTKSEIDMQNEIQRQIQERNQINNIHIPEEVVQVPQQPQCERCCIIRSVVVASILVFLLIIIIIPIVIFFT